VPKDTKNTAKAVKERENTPEEENLKDKNRKEPIDLLCFQKFMKVHS